MMDFLFVMVDFLEAYKCFIHGKLSLRGVEISIEFLKNIFYNWS